MNENLPEKYAHRQIRSFVLRTGRKTPAQQRAYEEAWPKYGLLISDGLQDFVTLFGRQSEVVFEIGFGMGDSLIEMALASPEKDFIGVEVHTPGVGRLLNQIEMHGLKNVRVYSEDAVDVLETCIADASLYKVQIFFPDPWHKKKHNKRRIIQPGFIQKLRGKLNIGGIIHLATDWENYAEHMMEVMSPAEGLVNSCGGESFSARPAFRPITKFERRGQRLGHGVWDLLFEKQN